MDVSEPGSVGEGVPLGGTEAEGARLRRHFVHRDLLLRLQIFNTLQLPIIAGLIWDAQMLVQDASAELRDHAVLPPVLYAGRPRRHHLWMV